MMNNHRGFTLLELLLATVLSTVLMVGVLAVITTLGAPALDAAEPGQPASPVGDQTLAALQRLLAGDIDHARQILTVERDRFVLIGSSMLGGADRRRVHRPVRVTYRLERIDGHTWLIRTQAALDVLDNQNIQHELVCRDVQGFELVSIKSEAPVGDSDQAGESGQTDTGDDESTPPGEQIKSRRDVAWHLRVWTDTQHESTFDRLVTIQREVGP